MGMRRRAMNVNVAQKETSRFDDRVHCFRRFTDTGDYERANCQEREA
jgi:hypothetical protein